MVSNRVEREGLTGQEDARNRAVQLARGPYQGLTHYHLQEVLAERPVYTLDHDIDVYKPVICGNSRILCSRGPGPGAGARYPRGLRERRRDPPRRIGEQGGARGRPHATCEEYAHKIDRDKPRWVCKPIERQRIAHGDNLTPTLQEIKYQGSWLGRTRPPEGVQMVEEQSGARRLP